jgi:hypothetical protein
MVTRDVLEIIPKVPRNARYRNPRRTVSSTNGDIIAESKKYGNQTASPATKTDFASVFWWVQPFLTRKRVRAPQPTAAIARRPVVAESRSLRPDSRMKNLTAGAREQK